jgi:lipoprotein-anchoring transpeptidase ErfK/SrfK
VKSIMPSLSALALLSLGACNVTYTDSSDEIANEANASAPAPQPQQDAQQAQLAQIRAEARSQIQDLHFLVDISDRKLRLLQGDRQLAEHPVAVGSEEWPTPTGSWQIHQVDINPEWIPPRDEEWAEEEPRRAPGDPENPLGRARLVYRMPNTIHGTDDVASLGKAQSHGSIRVANDVVLQLAETLLRAGGAWEGPEWFRGMIENRTREFPIRLEHPVPIEVRE